MFIVIWILASVSSSTSWKLWDSWGFIIDYKMLVAYTIFKRELFKLLNNMIVRKRRLNFVRWSQLLYECLQLWLPRIKTQEFLVGPLQSFHLLFLDETVICCILWARNWGFDWQDRGKGANIISQLVYKLNCVIICNERKVQKMKIFCWQRQIQENDKKHYWNST